jgi:hypothetical protein
LLLLVSSSIAGARATSTGEPWILRGRILESTEVSAHGHFEVGLYLSLGSDGLPVGYPVVQQILPEGAREFTLKASPSFSRDAREAYLFGELVSADGKRSWIHPDHNPWSAGENRYAELTLKAEESREEKAASRWNLTGQVGTLFAAGKGIPQAGVTVRVRGRKELALTNAAGVFTLSLPALRGNLAVEFTKPGFHPAILTVRAGDSTPMKTRLGSRYAFEQISQRLGSLQGSQLGIVLGKSSVPGLRVRLSQESQGPFYYDDRGVPTTGLRATSSDGRFLFLNVKPGAGFLESELDGETVAPVRISTVEGGQLLQKNLKPVAGSLRGRIFDAISRGGPQPLAGARVRIEGSADWMATTDSLGAFQLAQLRWMKGEKIPLVFSASHFQNHRYNVNADDGAPLQLFAFSAAYLSRLAEGAGVAIEPEGGIVLGKTTGPSVRIDALADHSSVNRTRDFYFDAKGRMRSTPAMTDPRFGTYLLFNVPAGKALLLGSDNAGNLRFSQSTFAGPSVVSVEVEN